MNSLLAKIRRGLRFGGPKVDESNLHLAQAFPAEIREDVMCVLAGLPIDPHSSRMNHYLVKARGEQLAIPYRIYHEVSKIRSAEFSLVSNELLQCILTRHASGLIRQQNLEKIVTSKSYWVPAFVVQLAGEYVVEILSVIEKNLNLFDRKTYEEFVKENLEFVAATSQRIESYWDCYYREIRRSEYPGFRIVNYFRDLTGERQDTGNRN